MGKGFLGLFYCTLVVDEDVKTKLYHNLFYSLIYLLPILRPGDRGQCDGLPQDSFLEVPRLGVRRPSRSGRVSGEVTGTPSPPNSPWSFPPSEVKVRGVPMLEARYLEDPTHKRGGD